MDFCLWFKENLLKTEFEEFAVYTWAVWKARQSFIHGDRCSRMAENVDWSSVLLQDVHHANTIALTPSDDKRRARPQHWSPPMFSYLKLNMDACVNKELNRYSVGGVLRDNQRRLLLAFGKQISQPISVVHGELLAVLEGVKLLYEKNFTNVLIKSDSLLTVQAVTAAQDDLGYVGVCASEIGKLLRSPVISYFANVSISTNMVAHHIACFASSFHSLFVWSND